LWPAITTERLTTGDFIDATPLLAGINIQLENS
jgi:hypothetical protein